MNIPEAVIQQFFKGECTGEEERQVRLYFIEHPGELEKYMTEQSWEQTSDYPMPGELTASMLHKIETATSLRVVRMKPFQWAAAAAVAILLAVVFLLWQQSPVKEPVVAVHVAAKDSLVKHENTSADTLYIAMADGSSITLEPKSSVAYYQPFRNNSRDIYLKGNGLFRVKNSKVLPFTVHTAQLATTVLGTTFRVKEDRGGDVRVRLYSGKVKVQRVLRGGGSFDSNNIVYLNPGQELLVVKDSSPKVQTFSEQGAVRIAAEKKVMPAAVILTFTDTPLKDVLAQLQRGGLTRIHFNEAEIKDMTFTGTYNPAKETAGSFLETLALLNGLTLKTENNIYYISR